MIFPKVWLVVKPTVGIPLIIGGAAVSALVVHIGILTQTDYFAKYWTGGSLMAPTASVTVEGDTQVSLLK
jgi:light-harvesting protein B-800-850 alpha chain